MKKNSSPANLPTAKTLLDMDIKRKKLAFTACTLAATALGSTSLIFATPAANPFESITKALVELFQNFYNAASGIVTVIAIVLVFVCLLMRMCSKDQRKVDAATEWLQRIIITWVIFIFLGNIQAIFDSIKGGSNVSSVSFGTGT